MSDFTGAPPEVGISSQASRHSSSARPRAAEPDQIGPLQGLTAAVLMSIGLWAGIAAFVRAIF